jgi:hypothetical protein
MQSDCAAFVEQAQQVVFTCKTAESRNPRCSQTFAQLQHFGAPHQLESATWCESVPKQRTNHLLSSCLRIYLQEAYHPYGLSEYDKP